MKDTYRHKGQRKKLVERLKAKGIRDEAVLQAIGALPRHFFLEKAFEEWAYQDKPFPIGQDQTISQPYTVAYQTSMLQLKPRQKVLEIGTGSGYQAAILAILGARVYTVERQLLLHQKAEALLDALGMGNVRAYYRDGSNGLPEFAPYDRILVTAGATEIPDALYQQLATGGVLVIPVGDGLQKMYRITKISDQQFKEEVFANFKFVPFLKGTSGNSGQE